MDATENPENERMQILKMIEDGQISAQEGLDLLAALEDADGEAEQQQLISDSSYEAGPFEVLSPPEVFTNEPQQDYTAEAGTLPESEVLQTPAFTRWSRWWYIPLAVGIVITVAGGLLMYWALIASGIGFWFACAWFPFLFGLAILFLSLSSRRLRWLHVRIHQKPGERPATIAISLPLPIGVITWLARTFGPRIHNIRPQDLEAAIQILDSTSNEAPFYVKVDEGDGEQVEVFIG